MQSPLWGEHLNQPLRGWPLPTGQWPIWTPQLVATKGLLRIQSNGMARAPATLPGSRQVSCKVILLLSQSPFRHRLSSRAKIAASGAGEYCDIIPRFSQQTPLQPADPACPLETKAKVLGDDFGGSEPLPAPWLQFWALSMNRNCPHLAVSLGEEECTVAGPMPTSTSPGLSVTDLQGPRSLSGPEAHRLGWGLEDGTQPGG